MDAGFITGLRTAAASAVATRYLAREDARTLGIFGTGVQAEFHALAIPVVRQIERVLIWGTSPEKARDFAERMQSRCRARVEAGHSLEAVAAADVVVTGTTAAQPLFAGDVIRPGAHVKGRGAHAPAPHAPPAELAATRRA